MKKILVTLLFAGLLMGCGGKPSGISDETYAIAKYAVKVTDLFLDGKATIEETSDKLHSINITNSDIGSDDYFVEIQITVLQVYATGVEIGTTPLSELEGTRNELADLINYSE